MLSFGDMETANTPITSARHGTVQFTGIAREDLLGRIYCISVRRQALGQHTQGEGGEEGERRTRSTR